MELNIPSVGLMPATIVLAILFLLILVMILRWIFKVNWQIAVKEKQLDLLVGNYL